MSEDVHQLHYELRLDAPALVTTLTGDPNTVEGETYLPGSILLGAFAGAWINRRRLADKAHQDRDFARLFLRGGLSLLNAYLIDDGTQARTRLLPVPASFRRTKTDERIVYDLAAPNQDDGHALGVDGANPARDATLRVGGYCRIEPSEGSRVTGMVVVRDPRTRLSFHTQRADRLLGRPVENGRGALFAYDALDGGQRFGGVISGDAADLAMLATTLGWARNEPLTFSIGRSRSAEYGGQARLELLDGAPRPWSSEVAEPQEPDGRIVLTLTSHLLPYPTSDGDARVSFPGAELARALQDAGVAYDAERLAASMRAFTRIVRVGGFSGIWRMPRPQQAGLEAGSVFTFEGIQLDDAQRRAVERRAFGMRTGEGFGRVVVNWHGDDLRYRVETEARRQPLVQPSEPPPEVFKRVVADTARRWAEDQARTSALALADRFDRHRIPSAALLARVALVLRDLDLDHAPDLLNRLGRLRPVATSQLRSCRGPRGSLLDVLTLMCSVDRAATDDQQAGRIDHELGVDRRSEGLRRVTVAAGGDPLADPAVRGRLAKVYVQVLLAELRRRKKEVGTSMERGA